MSALERLCRYVLRPTIATERLRLTADGRVAYDLARVFRDGTRTFIFEPEAFLGRLAALIPPPRAHLVTYSGVLAPNAALRPEIVPRCARARPKMPSSRCRPPAAAPASSPSRQDASSPDVATTHGPAEVCSSAGGRPSPGQTLPSAERSASAWETPAWGADRPRYYSWPELLRRVFLVDVLECDSCGGRREVIAVIVHQPVVRAILECLGLGDRASPLPSPVEEVILDQAVAADDEELDQAAEQGGDGLVPDEYP